MPRRKTGHSGFFLFLALCLIAVNVILVLPETRAIFSGSETPQDSPTAVLPEPETEPESLPDVELLPVGFLGTGISPDGMSLNPGQQAAVELGASSVNVYCKDKYQLVPLNGAGLSWSSSDESIATVNSSGLVQTHAAGTAVITASDASGNSDSCTVNVIKVAYITIDDVPNDITMKMLDLLDEYGVTATFFFNADNNAVKYYQEIYRRGHVFALHGYRHNTRYDDADAFIDNMEKCRDFLVEATGCRPDYVENSLRFPTGSKGSKGYKVILEEIQKRGYAAYDWTTEFHDYMYHYPSSCFDYFKTYLTHDRDIVLFHSREHSLGALPDALKYIVDQGYTFAPIRDYTAQHNFHGIYLDPQ